MEAKIERIIPHNVVLFMQADWEAFFDWTQVHQMQLGITCH